MRFLIVSIFMSIMLAGTTIAGATGGDGAGRPAISTGNVVAPSAPKGQDNTVYRVRYKEKGVGRFSSGPFFRSQDAFSIASRLSNMPSVKTRSVRIQYLSPGLDSWQNVAE